MAACQWSLMKTAVCPNALDGCFNFPLNFGHGWLEAQLPE
jgi:hypothetical protein